MIFWGIKNNLPSHGFSREDPIWHPGIKTSADHELSARGSAIQQYWDELPFTAARLGGYDQLSMCTYFDGSEVLELSESAA